MTHSMRLVQFVSGKETLICIFLFCHVVYLIRPSIFLDYIESDGMINELETI
jgi:hypothetical protein